MTTDELRTLGSDVANRDVCFPLEQIELVRGDDDLELALGVRIAVQHRRKQFRHEIAHELGMGNADDARAGGAHGLGDGFECAGILLHAPPDFREARAGLVNREARAGAFEQADAKGFF